MVLLSYVLILGGCYGNWKDLRNDLDDCWWKFWCLNNYDGDFFVWLYW